MTDDIWLNTSIMAKRGLAKGQAGKRHELTIEGQGSFHYVYGPYAKPVLTIDPGDVVAVETEDAFGGVITSEKDSPTAKLQFPFLNPQCGPIAVNGIEKGDCLAVNIHAVEPRGAQPAGKPCIIPEFGGLVGTASTAMLSAVAGAGEGDARRQGRRALERQDHPPLRAVYRHDRGFARDRGDLLAAAGLPWRQHGSAGRRSRRDPLLSGAYQRRPALCRRLPCHAGRRRIVGSCDRTARHRDLAGRCHQRLALRMAAARDGKFSHYDRQRPAAGRCGPHRLSRTGALDERRLRLRRDRRGYASQPCRTHPAR